MATRLSDEREPLAPLRRLGLLAIAYAIYVAGSPGVLFAQGTPLATIGVALWALAASRPGRLAFRTEWFAGTLGFGALIWWMGYVFLPIVPFVMVGYGVYAAYGGALLRRLSARWSLALATPLAWVGFESLLAWVPPPAGLSWLRLGHFLNDWPLLAGSGRVWGVTGLSFALAALAGLAADVWTRRRREGRTLPHARAAVAGLAPATLALGLAFLVPAPPSEAGPRLLLVQPAFEQAHKQFSDPGQLLTDSVVMTREALAAIEERREPLPDLVCWGETMLPYRLAGEGLAEAVRGELSLDPWHEWAGLEPDALRAAIEGLVDREATILPLLFGGHTDFFRGRYPGGVELSRALPEGSSFLSGVVLAVVEDQRLRRTNNVVLWDAEGKRAGVAGKVHLAPGGETMVGLERFAFVRKVIYELAAYVPDLLAVPSTGVLPLEGRAGGSWRLGATVCFDNAFTDVYAQPLREGPLDFHLIVSNEAWYRRSHELDQMIAFSRLIALCTGRSVVRATNGGVSSLIGPDGAEIERLVVGGEDRMVRGTLSIEVPVPSAAGRGATTPFVHLQPWLLRLGALLPLLVLLFGRFRSVTRTPPEGSGSRTDRGVPTLDRP